MQQQQHLMQMQQQQQQQQPTMAAAAAASYYPNNVTTDHIQQVPLSHFSDFLLGYCYPVIYWILFLSGFVSFSTGSASFIRLAGISASFNYFVWAKDCDFFALSH